MITKELQQLWNFEKLLKIMLFVYKKQDSIYRESIRSVSGSKCTLERLFLCHRKSFPAGKDLYKMTIEMLKGKIHRATVVQAELDYVGSITVDEELLEAAGILEYEKVQIVDVNNGSRFETYTICGERGSGMICLNGAAARCVSTGDKIIIMAYAGYDPEEARTHKPAVVFVDEENKISRVTNYEKHGLLKDMA